MQFIAADETSKEFLAFLPRLQVVTVGWSVKIKNKVVVPTGVVVYTKKKVILPATGVLELE